MPDLSALIERLEKASGSDREIDAEIWYAFVEKLSPGERRDQDMIGRWPIYTASTDAALEFVERVLPGCRWRVEHLPPSMTKGAADLAFWATCGLPGEQEAAYASTAPLAILIAALKALQERGTER